MEKQDYQVSERILLDKCPLKGKKMLSKTLSNEFVRRNGKPCEEFQNTIQKPRKLATLTISFIFVTGVRPL